MTVGRKRDKTGIQTQTLPHKAQRILARARREKRKRIRTFFRSVKQNRDRKKRMAAVMLAAAVILYLAAVTILRDGFFWFREDNTAVYIREDEDSPGRSDVFRIIFRPESGELIFSHEKVQDGDS